MQKNILISKIFTLLLLCLFCFNSSIAKTGNQQHTKTFRVDAIADNSIVLYKGEEKLNAGTKSRIRIKGNQHIVILKFDLSGFKGKNIDSATLVCARGNANIGDVTISTILSPWDEMKSNALTSGVQKFDGWAWKGSRFIDVCDSNSYSLVNTSKSKIIDGNYHWEVSPDLLYADILGLSFGLAIHEAEVDYSRNPTILANKSYLLIQISNEDFAPPDQPTKLEIIDDLSYECPKLKLKAPKNGFTYEIQVDNKGLLQWNIPFVKPEKTQIIPLKDLKFKSGEKIKIKVRTINRIGERSKQVSVSAKLVEFNKVKTPKIAKPKKGKPKYKSIAVIPANDKYKQDGSPVSNLPKNYLHGNYIFDGETIKLKGAKGEVLNFQVLVKGEGKIKIQCKVGRFKTQLWQAVYVDTKVGKIPDPCVPFTEVDLNSDTWTPIVVDVFIPFKTSKKKVRGGIKFSDGRELPIELIVRNFSIPRKASFLCEMNSYGLPDKVKDYYKLQEVAYDHRTHCNILHYSHNTTVAGVRTSHIDMMMDNGRRMNESKYNDIKPGAKTTYWDEFVDVFAPYISGSYFKDKHRGVIPAPGFYLSFHESWPLKVRNYFNGDLDAYKAFVEHPEYAETFKNLCKDFIKLAKRNGWDETGFQIYLNNKGSLNDKEKNPWILDEPTAFWDYRALAFYADLVKQAKGSRCPIDLQYRIDISRPHFTRGELDEKCDLWVVNSDSFGKYKRMIQNRSECENLEIWVYGTSNAVENSNRNILSWCINSYCNGAKGIVPWQTIDKDGSALQKADQLGIFIYDRDDNGQLHVHHSMRLKSYLRAEQDIEYLEILRKKFNLKPFQVREFVNHYLSFDNKSEKKFTEDAGSLIYQNLTPMQFHNLREAAAQLIEGN